MLAKYGRHPAVRNFISSLKRPATKTDYSFALSKDLNSETKEILMVCKGYTPHICFTLSN